ncbi:hypothetical protein [Streptomyces sp. NPDC060065]|uniref:hypothetical protein n=1 Tax=Streptomyces sp. NPDC060065 TaxID=3347050 RepID=UPI00369C725F
MSVMRDESGEPEVVEVGPRVDVDVEFQQAGLGADAVDDVIRIGGQFACQPMSLATNSIGTLPAISARQRSAASSSVRAEITI